MFALKFFQTSDLIFVVSEFEIFLKECTHYQFKGGTLSVFDGYKTSGEAANQRHEALTSRDR